MAEINCARLVLDAEAGWPLSLEPAAMTFAVAINSTTTDTCLQKATAGRLGISETHDVIAAIDVNNLTSDPRACIGREKYSGAADFVDVHIALQRGAFGVGFQHVSEAGDAARGKRFDRSR